MSKLTIEMERRRAEVWLSPYWKSTLGIAVDYIQCHASGPFQMQDGDYASAGYVCELDDGRNFMVDVEHVRFVDTTGVTE